MSKVIVLEPTESIGFIIVRNLVESNFEASAADLDEERLQQLKGAVGVEVERRILNILLRTRQ